MEIERWHQIKNLFYSASEIEMSEREDFLKTACEGDAELFQEVQSLLVAHEQPGSFMGNSAFGLGMQVLKAEQTNLQISTLGHYKIIKPIGSGGMGEVFLAEDPRLGRRVAIKLLPRSFLEDPSRIYRFQQEARAASSISHPNIAHIYEIGVDAGCHFTSMEFIDGITLRRLMDQRRLELKEAVNIALQVGSALVAAHTSGIIHRDIKPENIMIHREGHIKVLDFGLAKLTDRMSDDWNATTIIDAVETQPGMVMGSPAYMSPEQARGHEVDARTDIWSLGIVLYEMVTGWTPFHGSTNMDVLAGVLKEEPTPIIEHIDNVPRGLEKILKKMLSKDKDERYLSSSDLITDLKNLARSLQSNSDAILDYETRIPLRSNIRQHKQPTIEFLKAWISLIVVTPIRNARRKRGIERILALRYVFALFVAAVTLAGAISILALLFFVPGISRWLDGPVNQTSPHPQTSAPAPTMKALTNAGTSVCSAISVDGKLVAHAEVQGGKQYLVVSGSNTFGSSIVVPPDDVQYLGLSFSRDSNYLYFTRREKNGDSILYRVASSETTLAKVKEGVDGPISFSPQGDRFAFVRYDEATAEYFLVLSDTDGTNEQVVAVRKRPETFSVYGVAWSPDGSMVVCPTGQVGIGFHVNLVGFELKTGLEKSIGNQSWFSIFGVAWQNATSLVISARERETSPLQLWRIRLSDGTTHKITHDLDQYSGVSMAGEYIVTVKTNSSWQISVSPLDGFKVPAAIASGSGLPYGLSWTSKGKIVYSSMTQDRVNIFRVDPDGSNPVQLTINMGDNYTPASSADGRFIVFASNRNGTFNIWRMNADDGRDPTQLTFSDGNFYPSCSPDNQWVAYDNQWVAYDKEFNSILSVWKVPLEGGEPIKVVERYRMPVFSPDNKFIAARYDLQSGSREMAIFPAQPGGTAEYISIPIQDWQRIQWLPKSREVSFVDNVDGYSNIWSLDLDTGMSKQLTNFNSDLIYAYAWSPDYKQVACQRGTKISNVTMISDQ